MEATYTTINDLAAAMAEQLGLDTDATRDAIRGRRAEFARFEDVTGEAFDALARGVWADVTDGAAWPFGN